MRTITRVIAAVSITAALGLTGLPHASATECTPKGCTGGCRLGDIRDAHIDPSALTVELGNPIECTS